MTPFMLVFILFTSTGQDDFVIDHNLTGEDCIKQMRNYESQALEAGGYVACEFDYSPHS